MLYAKTERAIVVRARNTQHQDTYVDVGYFDDDTQATTYARSLAILMPAFMELWILDTRTLYDITIVYGVLPYAEPDNSDRYPRNI